MPPNVAAVFSLRDQQGYEGILPRRLEEVMETLEPGIVFEHHMVGEWKDAGVFSRPCVDFMGVRHVLSAQHEIRGLVTLRQFGPELCSVFENSGAFPRVTQVGRARVFSTQAELLAVLSGPTFDPANEVLLLAPDAIRLGLRDAVAPGSIDLPAPAPSDAVRWKQIGAGDAEVEATLASPRLLVVSESFHPGWKALDERGERLPVVPANHAFQTLLLPAGVTKVRISFEPRSLALGVLGLAFGLLVLVADTMLRPRRSRGRPPV
jgi:hypothetical protein